MQIAHVAAEINDLKAAPIFIYDIKDKNLIT